MTEKFRWKGPQEVSQSSQEIRIQRDFKDGNLYFPGQKCSIKFTTLSSRYALGL